MSHRITSSCESNDAWSSALLKRNLLSPRETAGQQLAGGDRLSVGFLSRSGKSLHRAKDFGHALGIIGEENGDLGANDLLAGTSANCPLLTGNRATASLENKLIEILTAHELHHLLAQSELAGSKLFELSLKDSGFVI
jgi:hypothetical protein